MRSLTYSIATGILMFSLLLVSVTPTEATGSPTLAFLTVNPTIVTGGWGGDRRPTVTVTLTEPAPLGGFTVNLSSSNPSVAPVPAEITFVKGQTTATFTIQTSAVAVNPNVVPPGVSVVISASHYARGTLPLIPSIPVTKTATLFVVTPLVKAIICCTTGGTQWEDVTAGGEKGFIWGVLTGRAPRGGAAVSLSSSNPTLFPVPASVIVPEGDDFFKFTYRTTAAVTTPISVDISAHRGVFSSQTATVTVRPPWLGRVEFRNQGDIHPTESIISGFTATGTVWLSGHPAAGAPVVVTLSSSRPELLGVPASVTVEHGEEYKNFPVTTIRVASSIPVTISATGPGPWGPPWTLNYTLTLMP